MTVHEITTRRSIWRWALESSWGLDHIRLMGWEAWHIGPLMVVRFTSRKVMS